MKKIQKVIQALSSKRTAYALMVMNALTLLFFYIGKATSNNLLAGNGLVMLSLVCVWLLLLLLVLLLLVLLKEILFLQARGWMIVAQIVLAVLCIAAAFHMLPVANTLFQAIRGNWGFDEAGYENLTKLSLIPNSLWLMMPMTFLMAALGYFNTPAISKRKKA